MKHGTCNNANGEMNTSNGVLTALEQAQVFSIKKSNQDDFEVREACDNWFFAALSKDELRKLGEEIIALTECKHDWEDGYSMNGPTRTCKKCGKFERD